VFKVEILLGELHIGTVSITKEEEAFKSVTLEIKRIPWAHFP
jgi:hypothetical protein